MQLLRRFVVDEESMLPTLAPGDGLIAVPLRRPRVGRLVVLPHPDRPNRWLVKRVAGVSGHPVVFDGHAREAGPDHMYVLSDNQTATLADSRTFGAVPVAGAYRVVARVPARWLGQA